MKQEYMTNKEFLEVIKEIVKKKEREEFKAKLKNGYFLK